MADPPGGLVGTVDVELSMDVTMPEPELIEAAAEPEAVLLEPATVDG